MHPDPAHVVWPDYQQFYTWLCHEVDGLTDAQLDFDSQDPTQEWMWWSIRRQVSHMAWDLLIIAYKRCGTLLWPDCQAPSPIRWQDHTPLAAMKFDRRLDETLYWEMPVLLEKVQLGVTWISHVVATTPIATLRAMQTVRTGTPFWHHVMQVIPRGVWVDSHNPKDVHYTLEASLWMLYWEVLTHLNTIQRLKRAQGLPPRIAIPREGYLTLPEYTGDTADAAPGFVLFR